MCQAKNWEIMKEKNIFTLAELRETKREHNHHMNMIEQYIMNVLELFDRKMCLYRGVTYDITGRMDSGRTTGNRQVIEPDDALRAAVMTPELARSELLEPFGECEPYEFQHTFVQRMHTYLAAKVSEVDAQILCNLQTGNDLRQHESASLYTCDTHARQAILQDSTILGRMLSVYNEQLQIYAELHRKNVRYAIYQKRQVRGHASAIQTRPNSQREIWSS